MKIISWNVNGIRACVKNGMLDFLDTEKPDVFCIQECKAFEAQGTEVFHPQTPYQASWHPAERPGYSGVVNFCKDKLLETTKGMGVKKFDQEGRVIITDLGSALLLNMYFPNGGMGEDRHLFKMDFLKDILKFFKKLDKEKPLILTGDFNIAHRPIDIHDPIGLDGESGFKPEERAWMDEFLAAGFTDAYRHFYPTVKDSYSWWSYRQISRPRNKGWRIDYFCVSNRLVPQMKKMEMLQNVKGSDHCPLLLEINL